MHVKSQSLEILEYFIDKEPGVGKGTNVSISPSDTIEESWSISISGLKDGQHFLYVRIKDSSGMWSPWQMQMFFVNDTTHIADIDKVEYFTGIEPGVNNGTNVNITPGQNVQTEFQRSSQGLNQGRHFMHVRAKTKFGLWSPWQFQMFFIEDTIDIGPINKMEYFIGKEPHPGNGTGLSITQGDTVRTEFTSSTSVLKDGRNYLHVRSKVRDGMWSPWQFQMIFLEDTIVPGSIQKVEYFVDKDNGVDRGTPLSINIADTIKQLFNYNTSPLNPGRHFMHVRVKNDLGLWSPWQFQMFLVESIKDTGKIISFSYNIDSSLLRPFSTRIVVLSPKSDTLKKTHLENTDTALNFGRHFFRIWTLQDTRMRSTWHHDTFFVINCPMLDTAIIQMPNGLCSNDTLVYKQDITKLGVWPKDSFNFNWQINGVTLSSIDSLKYKHNGSDSFQLKFSFTKKSDARCKGSLSQPVKLYSSPRDTFHLSICSGDSIRIHGTYRNVSGQYDFNGSSYHNCDSFASVILSVFPQYRDTFSLSACADDSVLIHGKFRKTTGIYFLDTTSIKGCDSLVWTILNIHPKYLKTDTFKICQADTLFRHGKAYSNEGVYTDTFNTIYGCDSVFVTNIIVLPIYNDTVQKSICQGDSIILHGVWRKTAGIYTFKGNTNASCDSLSTIFLDVYPSYNQNYSFAICQGDSLLVHGQYRNSAGTYLFNGKTSLGCDSTVNVQVIVNSVYQFNDSFELCQDDTLRIHGRRYASTGIYIDSFKSINGCDSIYISHVIVHPTYNHIIRFGICSNDSFLFDGVYRKFTDTITGRFKTINGCDSIVTLYLKVDNVILTDTYPEICEGDSMFIGGTYRYFEGEYTDVYTAAKGCDSIVTRHLSVIKKDTSYVDVTICQRGILNYHGNNYIDSGTYVVKLKNYKFCDSTIILNIRKTPEIRTVFSGSVCYGQGFFAGKSMKFGSGTFFDTLRAQSGCDSIVIYTQIERARDSGYLTISICSGDSVFTGKTWKKLAGNYADTLLNRFGCDSVIFTILNTRQVSATEIFDTICHGENIVFDGKNLSSSGSYIMVLNNFTGCDSVVTLHLFKRPQFVPRIVADGFASLMTEVPYSSYQWYLDRNLLPNDTLRKIVIVNDGIYDVSVEDSIGCRANSWDDLVSIGSMNFEWPVKAYPIPANEMFVLKSTQSLKIEIFNSTGLSILKTELIEGENLIQTSDWADGVYQISVNTGSSIFVISVVVLH